MLLFLLLSTCSEPADDQLPQAQNDDEFSIIAKTGDTLPTGQPFTFPTSESITVAPVRIERQDSFPLENNLLESYPLNRVGEFRLPQIIEEINAKGDVDTLAFQEYWIKVTASGPVATPMNVDNFNPHWRTVTSRNGLPSQQFFAAVEDELGSLWLSSLAGLIRYDEKQYEFWDFDQYLPNTTIRWEQYTDGWLYGRQEGQPHIICFNGSRLRVFSTAKFTEQGSKSRRLIRSDGTWFHNENSVFYFQNGQYWTFPRPREWTSTYGQYRFEKGKLLRYKLGRSIKQSFPTAKLIDLAGPVLVRADEKTICWEKDNSLRCFQARELPFAGGRRYLGVKDEGCWVQDINGRFAFWSETEISYYPQVIREKYPNFPHLIRGSKADQLWLRSRVSGLSQFRLDGFTHYYQQRLGNDQPHGISAILQAKRGDLWLGSHGGPLVRKLGNDWFSYPLKRKNYTGPAVRALAVNKSGDLWLGIMEKGLARKQGGQLIQYDLFPEEPESIFALTVDRQDRLWIGFEKKGLARLEGSTLSWFSHQDTSTFTSSNTIRALLCDRNGHIWAASQGGGLRYFDGRQFTYYTRREGLASNQLISLFEDSQGRIWIGSMDAGVMVFDGQSFTHYQMTDGLSSNTIYTINEDRYGHIWLGADNCLNRLDFKSQQQPGLPGFYAEKGLTVSVVCDIDGVRNNEFYANASLMDVNENLWWGGKNVLHCYASSNTLFEEKPPEISLIGIELKDGPINLGQVAARGLNKFELAGETAYFNKLIENRGLPLGLSLPTGQNVIGFTLSPANYPAKELTRFTFRLLGAGEEWTAPRENPKIEYRGLPPGNYRLEARAAGPNFIWSEPLQYDFEIRFPWWQRSWALAAWAITFLLLTYGLYRYALNWRLRRAETEKILELEAFKSRFYTNITHEFRTPITIIRGMSERIEGNREARGLIKRNANQLLRLVNQLLDLSKLDSGKLPIHLRQEDIISYCRYITESFYSLAEEKRQRLVFYPEAETLIMDFDAEKIQYILFNLLSNAIKFTPEGGQIILHLKVVDQRFLLSVKDNGPGISAEDISRVFDRFYQAETGITRNADGSGIGLAFTKELVKLLGGDISIESNLGKGTLLSIWLPVTRTTRTSATETHRDVLLPQTTGHFQRPPLSNLMPGEIEKGLNNEMSSSVPLPEDDAILTNKVAKIKQESKADHDRLLLLVEDNTDLVTYIQSLLGNRHQLLVARDGRQGLEMALEYVPDLIISDVMMPNMNGFQLCEEIKRDYRTNHIPFILLTAKSTQKDKVRGLTHGADAYLSKPFDEAELLIRIDNLTSLRDLLRTTAGSEPHGNLPSSDPQSIFMQQLTEFIESQLENAALSIPEIARALAMSQTQLYRKLKALTGQTPSQFVRSLRLQKGALLLCKSTLNIAEIAYAIGFSDPNYFSKTFHDAYGKPPSDYRKSNQ